MANNNGNFDFNIPTWLIILSFFVSPFVGIILILLKYIFPGLLSGAKKSNENSGNMSKSIPRENEYKNNYEYKYKSSDGRIDSVNHSSYNPNQKAAASYKSSSDVSNSAQKNSKQEKTDSKKDAADNPYYVEQQVKSKTGKRMKKSALYKWLVGSGAVTGIIGLGCLIGVFASLFSGEFMAALTAFGVTTGLSVITAALHLGAAKVKSRDSRFNRIRVILASKESYNLTKIAAASGMTLKQVRRDVQKLIDNGEFGESAYIDLGTNNFMRTPDALPDEPEKYDYKAIYGDIFSKKGDSVDAEEKNGKDKKQQENKTEPEATDDYGRILNKIRYLNDEIADEQVSEKIDIIEGHTRNIFDFVRENPGSEEQIRTFMNYYLPTTLKLLESYSKIEKVGVAGDNMKKSKENIENILDLLASGFEQQVDQLFKNESMDISSEIDVLETMMYKDGLGGKNSQNIKDYIDGYSDEITDDLTQGGSAAMEAPDNRKK